MFYIGSSVDIKNRYGRLYKGKRVGFNYDWRFE